MGCGGRRDFRLACAVVAGVTSNVIACVLFVYSRGKSRVDLARHQDHLAGYFFFRLGIAGEIPLLMASRASNAKGCSEHAHGGAYFFRLQNF